MPRPGFSVLSVFICGSNSAVPAPKWRPQQPDYIQVIIGLSVDTKTLTTHGPQLQMDCPSCGAQSVSAQAADMRVEESAGFIRTSTTQHATITCSACNRVFRSPISCEQLAALTPEQVSLLVKHYSMKYVGFIPQFLALCSLILACIPTLGLGCAIAALIGTRKTKSGWRKAAYVGLVISAIANVGLFYLAESDSGAPPVRRRPIQQTQINHAYSNAGEPGE